MKKETVVKARSIFSSFATILSVLTLASQSANAADVAPYFYMWGIGNSAYQVQSLMDAKAKMALVRAGKKAGAKKTSTTKPVSKKATKGTCKVNQ